MGVDKVEDASLGEGTAEAALEAPGEGGLTERQFAARLAVKMEQATQDAGVTVPPGLGEGVEPIDAETQQKIDEARTPIEEDILEGEEQPIEEEVEQAPEDGEEQQPEDEADFYVGRYRTKEAAEEGLAEKDRTIDRLFRELHEKREREEQQAEPEQPREIDVPAWHEWAEAQVGEGFGMQGAMAALEHGGRQAYDIYIAHWVASEDPQERAAAVAFNNEVQSQLAEIRALSVVAPLLEERRSESAQSDAEAAKLQVAEQHADFSEYEADMDRLIQEDDALPESTRQWLAEMANSGLEGKVRAWDYLYTKAKAERAPSRQRAAEAERKQRRSSADAAKVAASVSSSEATAARTPLTEAERFALERKNELRARTGLPLLEPSE